MSLLAAFLAIVQDWRSVFPQQVIVVLVGSGFTFRTPCLPGRLEQRQLIFRQLLTLAVALGFQQFTQQF